MDFVGAIFGLLFSRTLDRANRHGPRIEDPALRMTILLTLLAVVLVFALAASIIGDPWT